MPTQLELAALAGETYYITLADSEGRWFNWTTQEVEAYASASYSHYVLPLGAASGNLYQAELPAVLPDGLWKVRYHWQADASPAETDSVVAGADLQIQDKTVATPATDDKQDASLDLLQEIAKMEFSMPSGGIGDYPVDHDFGGTDNLRVVGPGGRGIDRVSITAYLKEDYDQDHRQQAFVRGRTVTLSDGRWREPLMLSSGEYILVMSPLSTSGPSHKSRTVQITIDY